MVHGPPTPPPTTSAEIQEAAAQASAARQAQELLQQPSSSSSGPDPYQASFPALVQAVSQNDWANLSNIAERAEFNATAAHQLTRLLIVAPLVLAYLIQDNIAPARHSLDRLPEAFTDTPLVGLLAKLTSVTSYRFHSEVYATAGRLLELVERPDFFDQGLGHVLGTLLGSFLEAFRRRTFQLLSRAYSSLPVVLAQEYLGVPADAILNEATNYGWTYEPSAGILYPKAIVHSLATQLPVSSLSTLSFVADSVGMLEA